MEVLKTRVAQHQEERSQLHRLHREVSMSPIAFFTGRGGGGGGGDSDELIFQKICNDLCSLGYCSYFCE